MRHQHVSIRQRISRAMARQAAQSSATRRAAVDPVLLQRALEDPESLTPEAVEMLQATHGNQFVNRLVQGQPPRLPIQAKLTVTPAGDEYEQEADHVASQVMTQLQRQDIPEDDELGATQLQRQDIPEDDELGATQLQRQAEPEEEEEMPPAQLQRQAEPEPEEEEEIPSAQLQRADLPEEEEPLAGQLQRGSVPEEDEFQLKREDDPLGNTDVTPDIEAQIRGAQGSGQPLSDDLRSPMEQAFGADFSGVRVHTGSQADTLNRDLQARAFTTGSDIFFRHGTYNPGSPDGQELLAHELTHVVQQGQGRVQTRREDE